MLLKKYAAQGRKMNEQNILDFLRNNPNASVRTDNLDLTLPQDQTKISTYAAERRRRKTFGILFIAQGEYLNNSNIFKHVLFTNETRFFRNGLVSSKKLSLLGSSKSPLGNEL